MSALSTTKSFRECLAPLFKLGTDHEAVKAVRSALAKQAQDAADAALPRDLSAEQRAWHAGAASSAMDCLSDFDAELFARSPIE